MKKLILASLILLTVLPGVASATTYKSDKVSRCLLSPDAKDFKCIAPNTLLEKNQPGHSFVDNLDFSPDGKQFVYTVANNSGQMFVVLNSKRQPAYKKVSNLTFSPDSKQFAYSATDKDGKEFVILNGKKQSNDNYKWIRELTFSPDSKQFAYVVEHNDQVSLFLNGKLQQSYVEINSLAFSPDSKQFAYAAFGTNEEAWVILNNKKQTKYNSVSKPTFSPDSKRLAYTAQTWTLAPAIDAKSFVVLDGKPQKEYSFAVDWLTFSPDSKRLGYLAKNTRDEEFFVIDGQEEFAYPRLGFKSLTFSPDSKQFAYFALNNSEARNLFVVLNSKRGPFYDRVFSLTFSPDSKNFAYIAARYDDIGNISDSHAFLGTLFFNGQKKAGQVFPGPLIFSPDSKNYAYINAKGDFFRMALNDQVQKGNSDMIYDFKFSSSGKELVYVSSYNGLVGRKVIKLK